MDMRTVQVCESSDSAGQGTGSASGQHTHSSEIEQLNLQTAHIRYYSSQVYQSLIRDMGQNVSQNFKTATFTFSGQNWSLCSKTIVLPKCCISYSNENAASEDVQIHL